MQQCLEKSELTRLSAARFRVCTARKARDLPSRSHFSPFKRVISSIFDSISRTTLRQYNNSLHRKAKIAAFDSGSKHSNEQHSNLAPS